MTTSLVLTFVGRDRPGLVRAISETVTRCGGSWLDSRLARLAGEFAGIVLVTVGDSDVAALSEGLRALETAGLRVNIQVGSEPPASKGDNRPLLSLEFLGHDRPGIVRDITQALVDLGANIEELASRIERAAFSGEDMFNASIRLRVPDGVTPETIRKALERLAGEVMVDFSAGVAGP